MSVVHVSNAPTSDGRSWVYRAGGSSNIAMLTPTEPEHEWGFQQPDLLQIDNQLHSLVQDGFGFALKKYDSGVWTPVCSLATIPLTIAFFKSVSVSEWNGDTYLAVEYETSSPYQYRVAIMRDNGSGFLSDGFNQSDAFDSSLFQCDGELFLKYRTSTSIIIARRISGSWTIVASTPLGGGPNVATSHFSVYTNWWKQNKVVIGSNCYFAVNALIYRFDKSSSSISLVGNETEWSGKSPGPISPLSLCNRGGVPCVIYGRYTGSPASSSDHFQICELQNATTRTWTQYQQERPLLDVSAQVVGYLEIAGEIHTLLVSSSKAWVFKREGSEWTEVCDTPVVTGVLSPNGNLFSIDSNLYTVAKDEGGSQARLIAVATPGNN